jgi:hypothetical protein
MKNPLKSDNAAAAAIAAAPPGKRQFMFAVAISVGACAGWYLGLRPLEQKFVDSRAELDALTTQLAAFDSLVATEPPIHTIISDLMAQGRRTNSAAFTSSDATRLYDGIHELAKACGVKLARVEPAGSRGRAAVQPSADKNALKGVEVSGYSIEVAGTYENICRFIDACERGLGVSKVGGFHIAAQSSNASVNGEPLLTAIVETTHLKIAIPNIPDAPTARAADSAPEPVK